MSKNFLQTLAEINVGKAVDECTDKLESLVREVSRVQAGGTFVLKLKLKPNKGGQTIALDYECDVSLPEMDRPTDFFFIGKDHSLTRHHPDQQKLDLVAVDRPQHDVIVMDRNTGEVING